MNSMTNFADGLGAAGIAISLTGMLIVFSGLLFLSLYIGFLPKILELCSSLFSKFKASDSEKINNEANDISELSAAISLILHLEKQEESRFIPTDSNLSLRGKPSFLKAMPARVT